jgi:hypothetical protein
LQIATSITNISPQAGNGLGANRFIWGTSKCGAGKDDGFIQVILYSVRHPDGIVDDGKHGLLSERPRNPPLYPGSHAEWYEDTPSVFGLGDLWRGLEDPFLYGATFVVCKVCLEECCWPGESRRRVFSVGPCVTFTYPGKEDDPDGVIDISDLASPKVPDAFTRIVEREYRGVISGQTCFSYSVKG